MRHPRTTKRFGSVASAALAFALAVGGHGARSATAQDAAAPPGAAAAPAAVDPAPDLRLVERASAPVEDRLAAARRVADALEAAAKSRPTDAQRTAPPLLDLDRVLRAAASLVVDDSVVAGRVALAALDAGPARLDSREALVAAGKRALATPAIAADAVRTQDA